MTNLPPKHIAIVMDGNGRWAKQIGLSRLEGHRAGVDAAQDIVDYCVEIGIPYLTLFAFSSENWKRPKEEVVGLMNLMREYLSKDSSKLVEKGIRVRTIGSLEKLPKLLQSTIQSLCEKTKDCKRLNLTVALAYGSRAEIAEAVKHVSSDVLAGKVALSDISENLVGNYLQTRELPDPDLFIRTGGEKRLSNFLLWQLSYTELCMTDKYWPDFNRNDLKSAIADYQNRERRFGQSS
ncbi:MAG: isoprenyl transferase [Deltaproteobacteria bacterium]|nr:isoprenyl transferase [Deltaproteobacteria bacterium]